MARIGETLTNARVRRGLSIDQAAQDTRIAARFIEALEAEDFALLPAPVYVRGFLRSYATYLKIDPASLLSELPAERGPRVASPDSFVSGPAVPRGTPQRGADPFRRPSAPLPSTPEPAAFEDDDDDYDDDPPPPPPPPPSRREPRPVILTPVPASERRGVVPPDEVYDDEERVRPRLAGVLVGSPGYEEGGSRVLVLAGIGVLVLLVVLAAAVFVTSRGGDDGSSSAVAPATTGIATTKPGTVIAVGSQTGTPKATATGSTTTVAGTTTPGATTTTTANTPGANPTATPTTPPANATDEPTATPTEAPTDTPTVAATATPTLAAPTPTPVPPTPRPTATPSISHPFAFAECPSGNCGPSPYRVVCAPDGWFIDNPDVGGVFNNIGGWPERSVTTAGQAQTACG